MSSPSYLAMILAASFVSANIAEAQSVRIQNGLNQWGFGLMFEYAGNCYVALPEHVAGPLPRISVYTAAPVQSDQATVQKPFWSEMDLAVAVIDRGLLDDRCTTTLDDFQQTSRTRGASIAQLHRITDAGEEERLPLQITNRSYLTLTAQLTRPGDRIGQGTSGAFAFVGETPIGMALAHDDPSRAIFLRAEEIAMHLTRYLDSQGFEFRLTDAQPDSETTGANRAVISGLGVRAITANLSPILPQHSAENLLSEGAFISRPTGPLEITVRLDRDDPTALSRLQLSALTDGYAVPRDVVVQTDATEDGSRFRFWTQGQMTPDGVFDTGPLAPRNARWVRVLIRSAWSVGDIALDQVILD